MNKTPTFPIMLSFVLKAVTVLAAFVGILTSYFAGKDAFMGGKTVFMYFTIQSNILIAVICAVGFVLLLKKKEISEGWYTIKYVGTVSITLTGVVFTFMLAPLLGDEAWVLQNTLTHLVVPLAAIADFFVVCDVCRIKKKSILFVTIPPLLYAIYAGIAFVNGWHFAKGYNYPYFFLNWGSEAGAFGFSKELPYMGVMWWILAILIFLIAIGYIYLLLADVIRKCIDDDR